MEHILEYLNEKYQPVSLIVYGSYADGTNGSDSDFDCLVVSRVNGVRHDVSIIDGVQLDAFIYHPDELTGEIDLYEFIQIENGMIVADTDGIAAVLQEKVRSYLRNLPKKTRSELLDSLAWCEKMLRRIDRRDAEGYYRWHWLLCDTLELYCDLSGRRYQGPKKSLIAMERNDPKACALYSSALMTLEKEALVNWIEYLKEAAAQLP